LRNIYNLAKTMKRNYLLMLFLLLCSGAYAQNAIISEFTPDPTMNDPGGEFFELHCPTGGGDCNVSCWIVSDGQGLITIPDGTIIPEGDYYAIAYGPAFNCATCDFEGKTLDLDLATCGCLSGGSYSSVPIDGGTTVVLGAGGNTGELALLYNSAGALQQGAVWDSGSGAYFGVTGGTIDAVANNGCAAVNNVVIPPSNDPALVNAGILIKGCNTSFAWNGSAWIEDNHPTPGADNALGGTAAFSFEADFGSGFVAITNGQTITQCTGTTVDFKVTVNNYQKVTETLLDAGGKIGSYFLNNGTIGDWPTISGVGTGTVTLEATATLNPGTNTFTLQWSDYKEGCCGSTLPSSSNECYEKVAITVKLETPIISASAACTDAVAGINTVTPSPANATSLNYTLMDGLTVVSSNQTGVFQINAAPTTAYSVVVSDACSNTVTATGSYCYAVPPCPEITSTAPSIANGDPICPQDVLDITLTGNNLPGGAQIQFYYTTAPDDCTFDPYAGDGTAIGTPIDIPLKPLLYQQDFNTLVSTPCGTTSTSSWANNSTLANWYSNMTTLRVNAGTATAGGLHDLGACSGGTATDRAMGGRSSGSASTILMGTQLTLTQDVLGLYVSFMAEQWRIGNCTGSGCGTPPAAKALDKFFFEYCTTCADITDVSGWTAVSALDIPTLHDTPALSTGVQLDGNAAANRTQVTGTINIALSTGATIWLRWREEDNTGDDHTKSMDDLKILGIVNTDPLTTSFSLPAELANNNGTGEIYVKGVITPEPAAPPACNGTYQATTDCLVYTMTSPEVSVTASPAVVCAPSDVTLTFTCATCPDGTAVAHYTVNGGAEQTQTITFAGGTATADISITGIYTLVALTDLASGCDAKVVAPDNVSVAVTPVPDVPTVPASISACADGSVTLAAVSNGTDMEWSTDNFMTILATGESISVNAGSVGTTTTYQVRAVNDPGGCTSAPATVDVVSIACPGLVLPIELKSFTVRKRDEKSAIVEWATIAELRNDYFAIERSIDGRNFSTLGKVSGAGTSNEAHSYQFIDNKPLKGLMYYRLRQVDTDGTYSYSDVRTVLFDTKQTILTVTPNPTHGMLQVVLNQVCVNETKIVVTDAAGREVLCTSMPANSNNRNLDVTSLANGTYVVSITMNDGVYTTRFVKTK
jgi:hypothetical protein